MVKSSISLYFSSGTSLAGDFFLAEMLAKPEVNVFVEGWIGPIIPQSVHLRAGLSDCGPGDRV